MSRTASGLSKDEACRHATQISPRHQQGRWFALLFLGLLCTLAPFEHAAALDTKKALTQYVHSVWRTDDGLPQSSVTKVVETSDGYLWVGTRGGLARFDGLRFTVFDHTNTPALKDDYVAELVADSNGTLWIATLNSGVTSYRNG